MLLNIALSCILLPCLHVSVLEIYGLRDLSCLTHVFKWYLKKAVCIDIKVWCISTYGYVDLFIIDDFVRGLWLTIVLHHAHLMVKSFDCNVHTLEVLFTLWSKLEVASMVPSRFCVLQVPSSLKCVCWEFTGFFISIPRALEEGAVFLSLLIPQIAQDQKSKSKPH